MRATRRLGLEQGARRSGNRGGRLREPPLLLLFRSQYSPRSAPRYRLSGDRQCALSFCKRSIDNALSKHCLCFPNPGLCCCINCFNGMHQAAQQPLLWRRSCTTLDHGQTRGVEPGSFGGCGRPLGVRFRWGNLSVDSRRRLRQGFGDKEKRRVVHETLPSRTDSSKEVHLGAEKTQLPTFYNQEEVN